MLRSLALLPAFFLLAAGGCNGASEAAPEATSSPTSSEISTGDAIVLSVGDAVQVEGYALRYVDLVEDSRCPEGTTCVWSGRAKVRLAASSPDSVETTQVLTLPYDTMNEDETDVWTLGEIMIELKDVRPPPGPEATGVPREVEIRVVPAG